MYLNRLMGALLVAAALAVACTDRSAPTGSLDDVGGPLFISNGVLDGTDHPNVGVFFYDANNDGEINALDIGCSGSLIDGDVFLTAAHCVFWIPSDAQLWVSFDPYVVPAPSNKIATTAFYYDPAFGHDRANMHDLAVLLLSAAPSGVTPVQLPTAGLLDELTARGGLRGESIVNVGYGVVPTWKNGPPRLAEPGGTRRMSTSPYMGITQYWLRLLMNNDATDEGGVCFGDSGSPHFLWVDGAYVAVATTTGGDRICRALSYNYRLDTQAARDFLGQYVSLP